MPRQGSSPPPCVRVNWRQLDHIRQIKNGLGRDLFSDRRTCFLTEEYKEDKIKVKRYFLMAKHLFTFLPLHLFTLPPFYLFTLSPFPPFHLLKGHQAKGTKIAFEQCFNISCSVPAYMYPCSNLSGTVFQMIWNEVPDKLEHEYKTYATRPQLNSCVIYT